MSDLRMAKSVRSIVKLETGPSGNTEAVEIYRRTTRRKKGSRLLKPLDTAVRRVVRAQQAAASSYLDRHERSDSKKRDGWIRDFGNNVYRASITGQKALKLDRLW